MPRTGHSQSFNDYDRSPHNYFSGENDDAMAHLLKKADSGAYEFGNESGLPLLRKVLKELNIPESSQVLVFSQTSLQRRLINPSNPRAMYFNEDTSVAWMPGGKVEVISFDPKVGGMFYFEEPAKSEGQQVSFTLRESCFGCHGGSATNFLPGPLARSNFTSENGRVVAQVPGHERIGHTVPFKERWGGYFVTNAPETLEHLGNTFAERTGNGVVVDRLANRSQSDLSAFFAAELLLRPDSDIIPMMVFDHQIEAQNLMMEAVYRDRIWHHEVTKGGEPSVKTRKDTELLFDKLVRYLLFADEVSIEAHNIKPNLAFESDFKNGAKTDLSGNRLKDFHLKGRLFQNRLSYMIDSRLFEEAPETMKARVYERLWRILSPEAPLEGYDYFEDGERERILAILRATKTDLPATWRENES